MSDRHPLDTATLLKRARRAARALGNAAAAPPRLDSDLGACVVLKPVQAAAYANTIWQLAGRLEDLSRYEDGGQDESDPNMREDQEHPPSTPENEVICDKHLTPIALNTACEHCIAEDPSCPFAYAARWKGHTPKRKGKKR